MWLDYVGRNGFILGLIPNQITLESIEVASKSFEHYRFLRLYSIDLDTALHTLRVLKRHRRNDVRFPLLRDIAVTYARPFSGNLGDLIQKHRLSSRKHVPREAKPLHDELVRLRMKQFAHTDLLHYGPRIAKFHSPAKAWYPMSFKGYDYSTLLSQVAEIEELIRTVEKSVHAEIDEYQTNL